MRIGLLRAFSEQKEPVRRTGAYRHKNHCAYFARNLVIMASYGTGLAIIHRVSKNVQPLACYNFDARERILICLGRNVTDKAGNQKTLYYATSNSLCFCTTWQNGETRKSHISLNWIVLHTMHLCAIFLKEKIVICDVFDSV